MSGEHAVSPDKRTVPRLSFEEKKTESKLSHNAAAAPAELIRESAHRYIRENSDDNAGTDAANSLTETAEDGYRYVRNKETAHRSDNEKKQRGQDSSFNDPDMNAAEHEEGENGGYSSDKASKRQQKRAIKKEYSAAKTGNDAGKTADKTEKTAEKIRERIRKIGELISRHKILFLIMGIVLALVVAMASFMPSFSMMFEGLSSVITGTTYPMEDADMLAAEEAYSLLEDSLREYIQTYERTHDYDEYRYDLEDIGHDPYVLISALTALKEGNWTADEIGDELELLFEKQYVLTETVETETRYRTERRSTTDWYYDPLSGSFYPVTTEYTEEVPYEYRICTVKLENFDLSHVPVYIMSEDQLSMYSAYMSSLGNRPDLFGDSEYVSMYYGETGQYEIPPEALSDERFALMIAEAEKYLGYPYVWGGSNPSTSFDCSGFVSWVCNNCGVGWNFGRLGAEGLRRICTPVSPAAAKPGDLVFFQGTYDTIGASHVGIYVGNGMMIHCGDPIQYSSLDTSYWQEHFLSYGRLPNP